MKIIGFGGLSSSGKTTVAKTISKLLPDLVLIHQDDFYFPSEKIPLHPVLKEENWDSPEAIDFDKFIQTLHRIRNEPGFQYHVDSLEIDETTLNFLLSALELKILQLKVAANVDKLSNIYLVDGFMLYVNQKVIDELNVKLFYKAPYLDCKKRRESRQGYNIIGGFWVDPPGYFDKLVWPEYYKYHKHLFVEGEDEDLIKRTGGELNQYAKELQLKDFYNPDGSTLFELVDLTLDYIIDKI